MLGFPGQDQGRGFFGLFGCWGIRHVPTSSKVSLQVLGNGRPLQLRPMGGISVRTFRANQWLVTFHFTITRFRTKNFTSTMYRVIAYRTGRVGDSCCRVKSGRFAILEKRVLDAGVFFLGCGMQLYSIPETSGVSPKAIVSRKLWRYLNDILLLSNLAGTTAKAFFVGPETDALGACCALPGGGDVGWLFGGVLPKSPKKCSSLLQIS